MVEGPGVQTRPRPHPHTHWITELVALSAYSLAGQFFFTHTHTHTHTELLLLSLRWFNSAGHFVKSGFGHFHSISMELVFHISMPRQKNFLFFDERCWNCEKPALPDHFQYRFLSILPCCFAFIGLGRLVHNWRMTAFPVVINFDVFKDHFPGLTQTFKRLTLY